MTTGIYFELCVAVQPQRRPRNEYSYKYKEKKNYLRHSVPTIVGSRLVAQIGCDQYPTANLIRDSLIEFVTKRDKRYKKEQNMSRPTNIHHALLSQKLGMGISCCGINLDY